MYTTHIRSVLEYCNILWGFSVTKAQTDLLNSVERRVISVIEGKYVSRNSHHDFCTATNMPHLEDRKSILLKNFGKKLLQSDRFRDWLLPFQIVRPVEYSARYNKNVHNFRLVKCKLERYRSSTIPQLVKCLRGS